MQTKHGLEVLLYLDELTYSRQPSLACAYEEAGVARPSAQRSLAINTVTRVVGALDACSGCVLFQSGSKVGIKHLVHFYQHVRQAYPQTQRIWIVLDNWPVHFHPDVLGAISAPANALSIPASSQLAPDAKFRSGQTLGRLAVTDPVGAVANLCILLQSH